MDNDGVFYQTERPDIFENRVTDAGQIEVGKKYYIHKPKGGGSQFTVIDLLETKEGWIKILNHLESGNYTSEESLIDYGVIPAQTSSGPKWHPLHRRIKILICQGCLIDRLKGE